MRTGNGKVLMAASVASMIDQFNMPNIRLLQDMGYEVHVACNFKEGNTCSYGRIRKLQKTLEKMSVVWHQWDCPRNIRHVWKCCRAYRQLWELTGKYSFAWMHCHSPAGAALARIAAHQRKIRVIYTAHGFHFYKGAPWKNWLLYYPAEKLLSYWTDGLVTVNQEDYCFAKKHFNAKRTYAIPGVGIDVEKFRFQAPWQERREFCSRYRIPEEATLLLSVGELSRRKNHRVVLSAMAGLEKQGLYYVICGIGPQKGNLARQAERLGIADRVRLTGFLENMAEVYRSADIFVFPSLQEGKPAALMEAMAAGLPCLVSDIRGNRELVGSAGGRRFAPGCPGQLRECLAELLKDQRSMGAYGRYNQKKIAGYGLSVVQKRMKNIYMQMRPEWKISILVAVYNPNPIWLRQQFFSVKRQSLKWHEVIILDDCSDCITLQQLQYLAEECFGSQEKVLVQRNAQNEGSDKTFEKLVQMAEGDYIAFCDQDDIWEEEKLEKLAEAVRAKNAVMAYSDMSVIDGTGRMICSSLRKMRKCLHYAQGENLTVKYLTQNCTAGCSMFVRSDLAKRAVPFCVHVCFDQWIAAYAAAYGTIAFVDLPLVRYRRHGKNQTGMLNRIGNRQDYYRRRILPMCMLVSELERRGIHYGQEEEARAFARARKDKDFLGIWKYRRLDKKYACFDLLMFLMPEAFGKKVLDMLRSKAEKVNKAGRKQMGKHR